MGIIKKENDEAFWLGADVGQTESVSHIPTQMTSYKGINAPLTNWEYSFFKGYLLRCGQMQKYEFALWLYFKAVTNNNRWIYFQNAKSSCNTYAKTYFILLNSEKQKIDADGNILNDDDTTSYNSYCLCHLPKGTYYCRIIRSSMVEIGDDIEFNVVGSQRIDIIVNPKLVKMEYKSNGISEEIAYDIDTSKTENMGLYIDGFTKDQPYNLSVSLDNSAKSIVFNYDISDISLNDISLKDIFSFQWKQEVSAIAGGGYFTTKYEYCYEEQDKGYIYLEDHQTTSDRKKEYTYYLNKYSLSDDSYSPAINGMLSCQCGFDNTEYNVSMVNCVLNSPKLIYNVEYSTLNHIWYSAGGQGWQIGYIRNWVTRKGELYNYYFDKYQVSTIKNIHPKVVRSAYSCNELDETYKQLRVWFNGDTENSESESRGEIKEVETNREYMIRSYGFYDIFLWIYRKVGDILRANGYSYVDTQKYSIYNYYQTNDNIIEAYSSDWVTRFDNKNNPKITDDSSIVKGFLASPIIYDEVRKGYENYFE